jgi:hypothetical protein
MSAMLVGVVIVAALALKNCSSSSESPVPVAAGGEVGSTQEPITRLVSSQISGFTEATESVIREESHFARSWPSVTQGLGPPDPPKVDFATQSVVLVAIGPRSSGGHSVRIESVTRSGGDATVRYTVTSPDAGCMVTQMETSPVEAISVAKLGNSVRFERRTVTQPC